MSNSAWSELYFVTAMMFLILVICVLTLGFFVRQMGKTMRERDLQEKQRAVILAAERKAQKEEKAEKARQDKEAKQAKENKVESQAPENN